MELERYDAPASSDAEGDSPQPVTLNGRTVVGYAVVWGAVSSTRRDGTRHVFHRGAITWTDDTLALWHHLLEIPLGGKRNATLRIVEDDIGARTEIDLDETTDGENALIRVKSRLVAGMSFALIPSTIVFAPTADPLIKEVRRAVAYEVSLTPTPAMRETNVVPLADAKNLDAAMKDRAASRAKNQLTQVRLAMLRPR